MKPDLPLPGSGIRDLPNLAWKLGGTNFRSQTHFRNQEPLFGSIPLESVFSSGDRMPFSPNTCIELEIAAVIPGQDLDELKYGLCFEIPQQRLSSDQIDVEKVLMDRCGANALVVQDVFTACDPADLQRSFFTTEKNDQILDINSMAGLVAEPKELLASFINAASRFGVTPLAGEVVALGGLGKCFPISPGEKYRAKNVVLGELEVTFI